MDAARWSEVRRIVEESLELPDESRESYIESACGYDAEIRAEVERLVRLYPSAGEFLETPPTLVVNVRQEADQAMVFRPGELVAGRFRIVRLIGFGGMGEVYEARDQVLGGLTVALKTVRAPLAEDDRLRARFRSEVELARKVTHPNVCRIHDLAVHHFEGRGGEPEEVLILTMELLPGETLSGRLRSQGPLEGEEAFAFAIQVIDALQAAHEAGVLHGDIKPNNVMLTRDAHDRMRAVVMDFGLARGLSSGEPGELATASMEAGAPAYMAPELLRGSPASERSDMYSLGALLYEAFTGQRPFPEVATFDDARQKGELPRPSPRDQAPQLDARLDSLVRDCLEPDPERRCRTAAEARQRLLSRSFTRTTLLAILLALAVMTTAGYLLFSGTGAEPERPRVVALLPFENSSGELEAEYFVQGLTDEIREALSRSPGTRVLARESSMEVGRARLSYVAAGERLGADYVVTGSVRKSEQHLRVRVRLMQAANGLELWSHEFEKPQADAGSARLEISAAIATRLNGPLAPQARVAMAQGSTTHPRAFDLYLQARHAMGTRATDDLKRAYVLLAEALKEDPKFAMAWVARAEARELLAGRDRHPFIDCMTEARQLALRALELDPELPEALMEIAMIRQRFEWDWNGAGEGFRRAVDGHPNSAEAHRLYAGFLSNLGRSEEAMEQIEQARALDPLSVRVRMLRAVILLRSRRFTESAAEFETLLAAHPQYRNLYAYAGDAYVNSGQINRALELHREAVRRFGTESQYLYNLAYVLALSGFRDEAWNMALELERRWPAENFQPTFLAKVWFGLKDADRAFYWMEKAWTERDSSLMVLNVEPWYDPYRKDLRFRDLVRGVGLDELKLAKKERMNGQVY
jgi:eukaryotic-like serine/threonine-protein kinase